ncbi:MAG: hypothetical protein JEZ08_16775 [Clostridiales bacterium]|nr:hypothetical protein [Clostridiales bacterium]
MERFIMGFLIGEAVADDNGDDARGGCGMLILLFGFIYLYMKFVDFVNSTLKPYAFVFLLILVMYTVYLIKRDYTKRAPSIILFYINLISSAVLFNIIISMINFPGVAYYLHTFAEWVEVWAYEALLLRFIHFFVLLVSLVISFAIDFVLPFVVFLPLQIAIVKKVRGNVPSNKYSVIKMIQSKFKRKTVNNQRNTYVDEQGKQRLKYQEELRQKRLKNIK